MDVGRQRASWKMSEFGQGANKNTHPSQSVGEAAATRRSTRLLTLAKNAPPNIFNETSDTFLALKELETSR